MSIDTPFLFLKTSRDTLNSKLNVKWKIVKHTHWDLGLGTPCDVALINKYVENIYVRTACQSGVAYPT